VCNSCVTALGRTAWIGILASLALGVLASAALGKGASSVVIQGPGLAHPLTIVASESGDSVDQLWQLMDDSRFFFGLCHGRCQSKAMLSHRPSGDLGPRYTLTYAMNLGTTPHQVVQYVFPFAQPQPVTYMPPGQTYLKNYKTGGGWYIAHPNLKGRLVEFGLPATAAEATQMPAPTVATAAHDGSSVPRLALISLAAAAAGFLVLFRSRRPRIAFMNRRRHERLAPKTG
jgi:hypothetical protein